jgi:hypothetical protein
MPRAFLVLLTSCRRRGMRSTQQSLEPGLDWTEDAQGVNLNYIGVEAAIAALPLSGSSAIMLCCQRQRSHNMLLKHPLGPPEHRQAVSSLF